jgi:hypothetical protein
MPSPTPTPDIEYLYAFGGSPYEQDGRTFKAHPAPRPPRTVKDLGFPEGTLESAIIQPDSTKGASTFSDPRYAPLTGHMYRVAKTVVEAHIDLNVIADGRPLGPHAPTHHTIYPARAMSIGDFKQQYIHLPWHYVGKK